MITKEVKTFDSVSFFRAVKKNVQDDGSTTLAQKKEFMRQIRERKIENS